MDTATQTLRHQARSCRNFQAPDGYLFILGEGVTSASCCLQKLTAPSTVHAELIAMVSATREALYLLKVISELGFSTGIVQLHSDSSGALSAAGNSSFRGRSKYLATRFFFFLRQSVGKGDLLIKFVKGEDQLSDMLSKHLARAQFQKLREWVQNYVPDLSM